MFELVLVLIRLDFFLVGTLKKNNNFCTKGQNHFLLDLCEFCIADNSTAGLQQIHHIMSHRLCCYLLLWRPGNLRLDGLASTFMLTSDQGRASALLFGKRKPVLMTHAGSPAGGHWLAYEKNKKNKKPFFPLSVLYVENFAEMLNIISVFLTAFYF